MSLSWWWLGVGAGLVAVLGGLHWVALDVLLDLGTRRADRWRDGRTATPGADPLPES